MAESNKNNVHGENGASFEESFGRLQEVVQKLSEGNLTLQEALSSFEEGMRLAELCTKMLDEAQLRVEAVSARSARATAQALEELEQAIIESPLVEAADDEVVTFEIESYERRTVIETPQEDNLAYRPLPWEKGGSGSPSANGTGGNPAQGKRAAPDDFDLDPLFDEEE
jgi:exodeoxyribonuclease VII small subunit